MKTVYLSVRLKNYEDALALVGVPLAKVPEKAEVLLLPGGGDVHPRFYAQMIDGAADIDEARDESELLLVRSFLRAGKPVVGICRGLQFINVYFGGTLRQHMEGHGQVGGQDTFHAVNSAPGLLRELYGARFAVNSAHHQRIEKLGRGLRVLACADDGTVEAIAHETLPVFAVQWHPERSCGAFSRPETVDGTPLLRALFR